MGNSHLHLIKEQKKSEEIMSNCNHWKQVDCDKFPDASMAKQCTGMRENCVLYVAKMIKINKKHDSCLSSANEAHKDAELNVHVKACDRELDESFYKVVDLYHEMLASHKINGH